MSALQVVWFKKDLRIVDHAPLYKAAQHGPVLLLYLFEPELIHQPDVATQHLGFALECLEDLQTQVQAQFPEAALKVIVGNAVEVFSSLQKLFNTFTLWSYEETGNLASYRRDVGVAKLLKKLTITWHELPNNGVVRRLSSRDRWSALWEERMRDIPLPSPLKFDRLDAHSPPYLNKPWPTLQELQAHLLVQEPDKALRQRGGRTNALALLQSFFSERGRYYRSEMSSPLTAAEACSRLSPYIAFGCVSIRELVHAVWQRRVALKGSPVEGFLASLKSFESRLHWHCHFIQKLESEPEIEVRNVNSHFNGLRDESAIAEWSHEQREKFEAWCAGNTGFPLVDACMRMVRTTGWVNFRMRAMLVSFSSYQLWTHWREPSHFMARQFLDYEPGIHYNQFQMQSGVTGINTIRIYNPQKQLEDQDPSLEFVKRWIPELDEGTYHPPIVDLVTATRFARDTIWNWKKDPAAKATAEAVFEKHGSRHPRRESLQSKNMSKARVQDTSQRDLF